MIGRTNAGGGGSTSLPTFTYTGTYTLIDDSETTGNKGDWRIKFLTSGTLTFTKLGKGDGYLDVFCVGGGGGGLFFQTGAVGIRYSGGGGGYTVTSQTTIYKDTGIAVTVGAGGAGKQTENYAGDGGASSFGSISASGGSGANVWAGGNGGSGGAFNGSSSASGGTNGGNGGGTNPGSGQGTTTIEFGESSGTLYSNGGNAHIYPSRQLANTGDGGFEYGNVGYNGYSGIVIIRNHRS